MVNVTKARFELALRFRIQFCRLPPSTTRPLGHIIHFLLLYPEQESNPYQMIRNHLFYPLNYRGNAQSNIAGAEGFEPTIFGFGDQRSTS